MNDQQTVSNHDASTVTSTVAVSDNNEAISTIDNVDLSLVNKDWIVTTGRGHYTNCLPGNKNSRVLVQQYYTNINNLLQLPSGLY